MEIFRNTVYQNSGKPAKTTMSGISEAEIGPPPEYGGNPNSLNPEDLFVAAINSCIMLVFFHFAKKYEVDVASYYSDAQGKVEKTKDGLRFTNVQIIARVRLGSGDSTQNIQAIAELAEKYCLVSNALICPVNYDVQIVE